MRIKAISAESRDLKTLEAINEEAIPANERCALSDMIATGADVLSIEEGNKPVGFIAIRHYQNLVYLAYFAVRKDLRSKGIGGRALMSLIKLYPEKQIVAEHESPDIHCSNYATQIRRKEFYLRNGFFETKWHTHYDGTEFEIICSRPDFDADEFKAFSDYIATIVSDHIPNPFPVTAP